MDASDYLESKVWHGCSDCGEPVEMGRSCLSGKCRLIKFLKGVLKWGSTSTA
jgi:hypothetical protein